MKRILAVASAALMTFATMGIATVPASAQHWGHHGGGGWHHGGWHHGGWHRGHGRYYGGLGAGILGGLIVGGALAGPSYYGCGYYGCDPYAYGPYYGPRVVYRPRVIYRSRGRLGAAHVQWCYDRYRSYRASDNTYQPYHGPRRQCYSPYG